MSNIFKMLKEKALEQQKIRDERLANYVSVSEVMKQGQINAKLIHGEFKKDLRGQECFYITLETQDGKRVVQKYTKTLLPYLYSALLAFRELAEKEKLSNEVEYLMKNFVVWRAEYYGRGYPRLYPAR